MCFKIYKILHNEILKYFIFKYEKIFRFIFPEKPGALHNFLDAVGSRWNISLFHYRNHGAAFGRVLVGLQINNQEKPTLLRHLNSLNYEFSEETSNNAYKLSF